MTFGLEYHNFVRRSISASILFASLVALPAILAASSFAQINGAPSSVTSPGFGGRAVNGPPASVTSLGPRGYSSNFRGSFSATAPNLHHRGDVSRPRHHNRDFVPPLYYAVPVPYAVDENAASDSYTSDDGEYQGGPTVFDRRGSGVRSYIPPVGDANSDVSAERQSDRPVDAGPAPDPTLLVFKDGHKLEVGNYAIVGGTLYDMTPGHPRKILIADLDLETTRQQNEDRGVVFQLPPSLQAN